MKTTYLSPSNLKQRDNILVIGGGPSFITAKNKILDFYNETNPLVITSNRIPEFPPIDYLLFIDSNVLKKK